MDTQLDKIEINPTSSPKACVIWLHGLGADGHDFAPMVPQLQLPNDHGIQFIFPHAPTRPITINGGIEMRGWYDILGFGPSYQEDDEGVKRSQHAINQLIDQQVQQGIPADKIILAGFSQGGAMALYAGLRYPEQLAGILALSTYLPLRDTLEKEAHENNHHTPIMLAHGTFDPIVHLVWGELTRDLLQRNGHQVTWHEYPVEHSVCEKEIKDVSQWLVARYS